MHTFEERGWTLLYNSDLSGEVKVRTPLIAGSPQTIVSIPGRVLFAFIAEYIRREKVADVEQMSDVEVLGLKEDS